MFTGIVEGIGTIVEISPAASHGGLCELRVDVAELSAGVKLGDSIALTGCCLTVTALDDKVLAFQAVPETLRETSLGSYGTSDRINVERAMPANGRLDGHIVQGHVDGTGTVRGVHRLDQDVRLEIDCRPEIDELLVAKGSIAVDGVSLTVVAPQPGGFSVALIPHTLGATTLNERREGDLVNLEADIFGKYVLQYLKRTQG